MPTNSYLAVRLRDSLDPSHKKAVLDMSTARLSRDLTKAITRSGAWHGSVFAVWKLPNSPARSRAMETAWMLTPDEAWVLTDLGVLAEVDINLVRDAEIVKGDE